MSNGEVVVSASDGASAKEATAEEVKAAAFDQLKRRCIDDLEKSMAEKLSLKIAEAPVPSDWEIWALGPFQTPTADPARIIKVGESAFIVTVVFLNTFMRNNVTDFGAKVLLEYHTSNTQTMLPVLPPISFCFDTDAPDVETSFGAFYFIVQEIKPTEAACLMETNICARICNCEKKAVPGYAAFVRWVANADFDLFFPPVGFQFDHPIRYLVYDENVNCECE